MNTLTRKVMPLNEYSDWKCQGHGSHLPTTGKDSTHEGQACRLASSLPQPTGVMLQSWFDKNNSNHLV
jgi:hypothetical protein